MHVGSLPLGFTGDLLFGPEDAEVPSVASFLNFRDWKCRWCAVCQASEIEFGSSSFHAELEKREVLGKSIQYGTYQLYKAIEI